MLQTLKNWWNKDKIAADLRMKRIEDTIHTAEVAKAAALAELETTKKLLAEQSEELAETSESLGVMRSQAAADDARRNGKEPWVEIKSAEFNEVKGIQIELDWNEAFVQYLKENGVKARNDDQIVQKWLMMLYADLIEKFETQIVEDSDKPRVNDFE